MASRWSVKVPRDSVNDDEVVLSAWLVDDGEHVESGMPIAEFETSKAVTQIAAEQTGYLTQIVPAQKKIMVGAEIGAISSEPLPTHSTQASRIAQGGGDARRFSLPAQELIELHGLDQTLFDGRLLVRAKDVLQVLGRRSPTVTTEAAPRRTHLPRTERVPLSPRKQTEIRYLNEVARTGLVSSVTTFVPVASANRLLEQHGDTRVSCRDLVIHAAAARLSEYREFNSFVLDDAIEYYADINIGVAVNMGEGLVVPVIRKADAKSVEELSQLTSSLIMKYLRRELVEEDLVGGTFTVTDLSDSGAALVSPLINRDQSAILAIGRTGPGDLAQLSLTLAFDHRASDGLQAARFLDELRAALTYGDQLMSVQSGGGETRPRCHKCGLSLVEIHDSVGDVFMLPVTTDKGPEHVCSLCLLGW